MHGVPVIVAGSTHYKGKGFTVDPEDWNEYVDKLKMLLHSKPGGGISDAEVKMAWRYAYRYFFDYPFHIPWHLITFWDDLDERPLEEMVVGENFQRYLITLQAFAGLPIDWGEKVRTEDHPEVASERS